MRHPAIGLLAALVLFLAAVPAAADSWMAPVPVLDSTADGRWYVIAQPTEGWKGVRYLLVERAEGKPPREAPDYERRLGGETPTLAPEPGDRLVAEGALEFTPMKVRCLPGGRGFVLFETYGNLGFHRVLQVRDAKGKVRWSRDLRDLFSAERIETFTRSVSSIWWYQGVWIDEAAGDVVVAWEAKDARGILRVALETGEHRAGEPGDLLRFLDKGSAEERIEALTSASEREVEGLVPAVQAAFADAAAPLLARLHFAVHLQAAGDPRGREVVVDAAQPGRPPAVREYAVRHLTRFVPTGEALPLLEEAMRAENDAVWRSSEEGLRKLGGEAVEALTAMILDEGESERFRAGAATALWNMGAPAAPALPALEKAAQSGLKRLVYAATHAIDHIREQTGAK